jgi:hypothetical protein
MRPLRLWWGVIGAPVIWLLYLQAAYMMATWSCAPRRTVMLIITIVIAAAAVSVTGWIAWQSRQRLRKHPSGDDDEVAAQRSHFLVLSGLGISALIALLVLASAIPIGLLQVCE